MMRSLFSWLIVIAVLASAAFALDRYFTCQQLRTEMESRTQELEEVSRIVQAHPATFSTKRTQADVNLKLLVQQVGTRNGIVLNNLGENERDLGEKTREHCVFSRMSNVPHSRLVTFLAELESQGEGARIKELRLTPDTTRSGMYKEVESTLAMRWSVDAASAVIGSIK